MSCLELKIRIKSFSCIMVFVICSVVMSGGRVVGRSGMVAQLAVIPGVSQVLLGSCITAASGLTCPCRSARG